jgi:hypothetical protein
MSGLYGVNDYTGVLDTAGGLKTSTCHLPRGAFYPIPVVGFSNELKGKPKGELKSKLKGKLKIIMRFVLLFGISVTGFQEALAEAIRNEPPGA